MGRAAGSAEILRDGGTMRRQRRTRIFVRVAEVPAPRGAFGLVAVMLATALVVGMAPPAAVAAVAAARKEPSPTLPGLQAPAVSARPTAGEAATAARAQGSRVEITDLRTASSSTFANPDGSETVESSVRPFRVKRGDSWVPADETLGKGKQHRVLARQTATPRSQDRTKPAKVGTAARVNASMLTPKAPLTPTRISTGGEESSETPLAEVGATGGKALALFWPTDLPAPEVNGPEARYDVSATEDVTVTAVAYGFDTRVVLEAEPEQPPVYRFPIATDGVTLGPVPGGGYAARDANGREVFVIPPLVMWDSSPGSDPDVGPDRVPVDNSLEVIDGQLTLELRPSPQFLRQATYPVQVDPVVLASISRTKDTYVRESNPTTAYGTDVNLRVGYVGGGRSRAYLQFNTPYLPGRNILSAALRLYQWDAITCTATPVKANPISEA
jgi:hypothetical protein